MTQQSCAMVRRWRILGDFNVLHFQRAACGTFQIYILNSHNGHTMCGSMVDTQSATAEIRRGKKKELECGPMPNVMVALPNIGGALCSTPQSLADAHYLTAVQ